MNMTYKFTLTYDGDTYNVHPIYKDDLAINYELEPNQKFFREKLSGNLVFVGEEAEHIIDSNFTTEFVLDIYSSVDGGLTWSAMHKSRFYLTDCQIDADNKRVTVKPDVKDRYNTILDGLEKEYNLIELLPVTEKVSMKKRALLQLYSGDGKVTNVFGGFSWEDDFDIGNDDPADYHFQSNFSFCVIKLKNYPAGTSGLTKSFIAQPDANAEFETTNGEGVYYLKREKTGSGWTLYLRLIADDSMVAYYYTEFEVLPTGIILDTQGGYGYCTADVEYYGVYARYLCDVESFVDFGTTYYTTRLSSNDPSYGGNLHYVIPWQVSIVPSNNVSTTPTKWGKMDDTYYYDMPSGSAYYIPVARSFWSVASIWYQQRGNEYSIAEPAMQKEYTLNDSYPLWSVLQVLLTAIGSNVTFSNTADYSSFFYGNSNPVYAQWFGYPHITPKSNITSGEYTQPAMKAPITLQDVFLMLAKAFNCYWFIDDSNRLRIEHISWFKNGGSYGGTHQIGMDLTAIQELRNGKAWSFDTSKWQYDKVDMPARYQYKWMDEGTDIFDGWPFEMVSPFVQTDKVEEITISNITSDVDYMQIAPENVSKDGFALLLVAVSGGTNYLPLVYNDRTINGRTCYYYSQNYYGSLRMLQTAFLNWNLPAWTYKWMDDTVRTAPDIMRGKRQQVEIPYGNTTPDVMKLVRTAIGDGQVQTLSLKLSSRMANTTIMYDTY